MEQQTANDATPAKAPREVISRAKLWEGGSIEIIVPSTVQHHEITLESNGQKLNYIRFAHFFRGGAVNIFVHAQDPKGFIKKKLVAKAELWKKVVEGGREYFYVDLYPIHGHVAPTHDLKIVSGPCPERYKNDRNTVFDAPAPSVGAIVIRPLRS